ncbi:TetR/AcrR family transcriptional regulator [Flavisphingomonas formosensis]|uniref:TetR/AcrR family transcriptional regulator n=1 Tax=Flavisphingomonas formosensis TaxID=861534 RepID=UPI0012FAF874|nr:hypothetical protein [Sphingomonas formosensis]
MTSEAARPEGGVRAIRREERRQRLVRAARELLSTGDGGFSMIELARQAELSLATPYNLFGSKAAILHAVFASEVTGLRRSVEVADPADPPCLALSVADHIAQAFARKPNFYRNLSRSLSGLGTEEVRGLVIPLGDTLLAPLVEAMAAAGMIRPAMPHDVLVTQLAYAVNSIFVSWAVLDWPEPRMAAELRVAITITLLGALTDPPRAAFTQTVDGAARALALLREG